ncbi:MAG: PIG-L family deacetylase [Candidatus Omnitrophica bacterium]|nr:PIG-L family deacetylase [Candidatus Omnitrophota bacterium]
MKHLVLAAHPDDEVLGCGGTIAKRIKEGDEVTVAILTDGAVTRYKKGMAKVLKANTTECAKALGVSRIIFKNLPNQLLDAMPITKVIKEIEGIIKETAPDMVYTHDKGDLNRDHVVVYEATLVAARPLPGGKIKGLFTYFVPSSSEYNDVDEKSVFIPNVFVEINQTIDKKIKAFTYYKSEVRPYPHPRSPEALRVYAKRWGIQAGVEYAEAFRLIRGVES